MHLDTCLTAGQPVWNRSGTLFEGISCWAERKKTLSKQDVKERASRAVRMMVMHGVQHVRTHVDVTDPTLAGMEAMLELREELRPLADIQIVAFPQKAFAATPTASNCYARPCSWGRMLWAPSRTLNSPVNTLWKASTTAWNWRRNWTSYDDIMQSYRFITHNAARTLHLGESYGIRVGNPANMILLNAENYYDALNTNCEVLTKLYF